eukprot:428714_1
MAVFNSLISLLCLANSQTTTFKVDLSGSTSPVWPFYESMTTYDHAYPALRADWQQQLKMVHDELGTKFVRFMGTFGDDIGISNPKNPSAPYSYLNIDVIYDYILSIGMKPSVELDFVPQNFLKDPQKHLSPSVFAGFPMYEGPPDNNTQWYDLIHQFVTHLVDRYGSDEVATWVFDFWDEPNTGKWINKNLTSFEETYKFTAKAIHDINDTFKLGAPGTAGADWIPSFPQWTNDNNIKLDWVSTHLYPPKNGIHNSFYLKMKQLSQQIKNVNKNYGIGITAYGCELPKYGKLGLHDTSYNAACFSTLVSQFQQLDTKQFQIMSFTGFTDLWDQGGMYSSPFHDGYGWVTNRGIKKATYHSLRLLHQYATDRNYFIGLNTFLNQNTTTLELFATIDNKKSELSLFVMNWILSGQRNVTNENVEIVITGNNGELNNVKKGTLYRIDNDNCNPQVIWQTMGEPFYPTKEQINKMVNASNTYPTQLDVDSSTTNSITFKLNVPAFGWALIVVEL